MGDPLSLFDDTTSSTDGPSAPNAPSAPEVARTAEEAITTRRSVRAYLDRPVSRELVERILMIARNAPSGSNVQPWRAYVLLGKRLQALGSDMKDTYLRGEPGHKREYNYYEIDWTGLEPYAGRRQACGWGLYSTLRITRQEKDRLKAQRATNFNFFSAPVGLVFTIKRCLELGSWLDYGMFLQSINLAARGFGLHSCTQASISEFPLVVRRHLPVGEDEIVVAGMAIGYKDAGAPVNQFLTPRAPLAEFATFLE